MASTPGLKVLILFALAACGNPIADEMASYHTAMDPLMTENTKLASQFLVLAQDVLKDKDGMDRVVTRLEGEVIPAANGVKAGIESVEPGLEELQDVHQQAINAWTLQSQAYREMVDAYKANDPVAFQAGQKKHGQAKVTIEIYVKQVNRLLEPYGYHLDEFPPLR